MSDGIKATKIKGWQVGDEVLATKEAADRRVAEKRLEAKIAEWGFDGEAGERLLKVLSEEPAAVIEALKAFLPRTPRKPKSPGAAKPGPKPKAPPAKG